MNHQTPDLGTIEEAHHHLQPLIHHTPLVKSQGLSQISGVDIRFKAENLQRTGSFKIRGALTKVRQLAHSGCPGVVTASSGNHGQAVAWAARYFSLPCHVVVPTTAPRAKIDAARSYGAIIHTYGTTSNDRLTFAEQLAKNLDYQFVPPYDDVAIMSGQGTVGLEILADWPDVNTILVPIGGGGLISGIATAVKARAPHVRVVGVEPEGAAKATASRQAGQRTSLETTASIADGLLALTLGRLTHPIIEQLVDDIVTVSEEQIRKSWWLIASRLKLVTEPSGATAAAYAFTSTSHNLSGRVAVVLSGGNLDAAVAGQMANAMRA